MLRFFYGCVASAVVASRGRHGSLVVTRDGRVGVLRLSGGTKLDVLVWIGSSFRTGCVADALRASVD